MQSTSEKFAPLLLLIAIFLGALLRFDFLLASDFRIDADEAIVGLMGKHILEGQGLPIFYYGQEYMGSFEALVASLIFSLMGVTTVALKFVPFVFSLLLIPLMYCVARELRSERAGLLAAYFTAIPPATLLLWSTKARGGFIEILVLGALSLLFAIPWLRSPRPSLGRTLLIGLVLGFAWWINNQAIYFMLPIGFAFIARLLWNSYSNSRLLDLLLHGIVGLWAFLIGGLPFWFANIQSGFASFGMLGRAKESSALQHFEGFIETSLPILMGAKRYWQTQDLFGSSSVLILGFCVIMLVVYVGVHWRAHLNVFVFKLEPDDLSPLLTLGIFATVSVFCLSSFGYLVEAPRYLLPLYVPLLIMIAVTLDTIHRHMPSVANLLTVLLVSLFLCSCFLGGRSIPGEPFVYRGDRVEKDHEELYAWFAQNEISWVRTNYWIGYRIAFETEERVRFIITQEPYQTRIESYDVDGIVYGKERMPYVLTAGQSARMERGFRALGLSYDKDVLSGYHVLSNIQPLYKESQLEELEPSEVFSPWNPGQASAAVDDDLATRWGSAAPQEEGMYFVVEFERARDLAALRYSMGRWPHDYPRSLEILADTADGDTVRLLKRSDYPGLLYYLEDDSQWEIQFPKKKVKKITLLQEGQHKAFDWSIAELSFLAPAP